MIIDRLIEGIATKQNPTVVGLDTSIDYLQPSVLASIRTTREAADAIIECNLALIERLAPIVPAFKVQVAYYEMYGLEGMRAFATTLAAVREAGCVAIADCKRNDIGATAACYSRAYLGRLEINGQQIDGDFAADMLTVNAYLGSDGIQPFVDDCTKFDRGLFVLVKTSNPGSAQLQDLVIAEDDSTLFGRMGALVAQWGQPLVGKYGYSSIGAVVGATHPAQATQLRAALPGVFFLVPGYGAQGGTAADLAGCFDQQGRGAIVNNSRGILCAWRRPKYAGQSMLDAAYHAAVDMRDDIALAISKSEDKQS